MSSKLDHNAFYITHLRFSCVVIFYVNVPSEAKVGHFTNFVFVNKNVSGRKISVNNLRKRSVQSVEF